MDFLVDSAGVDALIQMALVGLATRGTLGLVAVPPLPERRLELPLASLLIQGQAVRGFVEGTQFLRSSSHE